MSCTSLDLTIEGALADPVIGAAMRADRVDPKTFEGLLRTTARRLDDARPSPRGFDALLGRVRGVVGSPRAW